MQRQSLLVKETNLSLVQKMYENTACFDPNSMAEVADDGFSQSLMAGGTTNGHNSSFEENLRLSMEELSCHPNPPPNQEDDASASTKAMEFELQQQLGCNMENCYNSNNNNNTQFVQDVIHDFNQVVLSFDHDQSNWDPSNGTVHEMQQLQHQVELQNCHQSFNASSLPTPDLLNLFHLPRCSSAASLLPNSSISFANPTHNSLGFVGDLPAVDSTSGSSVLYDPLFHLNLPPQPPSFRELFQSLPHGYSLSASRGALFASGGDDQREGSGVVYPDGDGSQFDNTGVLEFTRDMANSMVRGRNGKLTKHFATERQRRDNLNGKYQDLKSLVPNPTKADRASIVGDAIEYIKELLRTVNEFKIMVEQKRCGRERCKRHKKDDDGAAARDVESSNMKPLGDPADQSYSGSSLRSSWLQRRSKNTEVDVRIIDDEVTIKLVQRKKINCLLSVSKVLDELQLDLHHLAGGHIGDHNSFLFNTKIYEGSSVYASAIANKLIEVVDRQYAAAIPPTNSY